MIISDRPTHVNEVDGYSESDISHNPGRYEQFTRCISSLLEIFDTELIIEGDKTPCLVVRHQDNEQRPPTSRPETIHKHVSRLQSETLLLEQFQKKLKHKVKSHIHGQRLKRNILCSSEKVIY